MSHQLICRLSAGVMSVAFLCIMPIAAMGQGQADDAQAILKHMSYLKPLVGTWDAVAEFHEKDGLAYERGIYKISSVLDGSYLQWDVVFNNRRDPSQQHSFMILITYNPVTQKYDSTYFYSRWSLRVTEVGEYDDKTKQFKTTAFIPLEDGTRDETVRTITTLGDDKVDYLHYSRYNDEKAERLNLETKLTRRQ